jgi:hypothetical protein
MDKNIFVERERALEDEFFYRVDKQLLSKLRRQLADEAAKSALASASGFTDDALLNELVQLRIAPETLGSLSLVPLILVAWSDRRVDRNERLAVLTTAVAGGIGVNSPAYGLLEFWLENEPTPQLAETWKHFVKAILGALSAEARALLKKEILDQARKAAQASREGFTSRRVSTQEHHVLQELEVALTA